MIARAQPVLAKALPEGEPRMRRFTLWHRLLAWAQEGLRVAVRTASLSAPNEFLRISASSGL